MLHLISVNPMRFRALIFYFASDCERRNHIRSDARRAWPQSLLSYIERRALAGGPGARFGAAKRPLQQHRCKQQLLDFGLRKQRYRCQCAHKWRYRKICPCAAGRFTGRISLWVFLVGAYFEEGEQAFNELYALRSKLWGNCTQQHNSKAPRSSVERFKYKTNLNSRYRNVNPRKAGGHCRQQFQRSFPN